MGIFRTWLQLWLLVVCNFLGINAIMGFYDQYQQNSGYVCAFHDPELIGVYNEWIQVGTETHILQLSVCLNNQNITVNFSISEFKKFYDCLCDVTTLQCQFSNNSGEAEFISQPEYPLPCLGLTFQCPYYVRLSYCKQHPDSIAITTLSPYYPYCWWFFANKSWSVVKPISRQHSLLRDIHDTYDDLWNEETDGGGGTTSTSGTATSGKVKEDPLSKTHIIIIIVSVIAFVILVSGCVFMIKRRMKSSENNRNLPAGSGSTSSDVTRHQGNAIQKKHKGNEGSQRKPNGRKNGSSGSAKNGDVGKHTRNNTYTSHNNTNRGDGITNTDSSENVSEYATLDEITNYNHLYKTMSDGDPKLRPAMPLPPHVMNQNIPYYSLADSTSTSSTNQDTVSAQYLELCDASVSNQPISSMDYIIPIAVPPMNDAQVFYTNNSYVSLSSTNDSY